MNEFVIRRSSEPHKMDTAPQGTLCVVTNSKETLFYLQESNDVDNPRWEKINVSTEQDAIKYALEFTHS